MKQGVITSNRVRLLLRPGDSHFQCRRDGYRKRKSVRGCIVSPNLAVLNLVILKRGPADIAGLTDEASKRPSRYFLKRASKIRKLFSLTKEDNVRDYQLKTTKTHTSKSGKSITKVIAPAVQRLITGKRIQQKLRYKKAIIARGVASKKEAEEFNALITLRRKQLIQDKQAALAKKRSVSRKLSERKASEKV